MIRGGENESIRRKVCPMVTFSPQILHGLNLYGGHAAGGAVGRGTALQAGRSRVRFPMV